MNRKETIKPCLTVTKREGDTYIEGPLKRKRCTLHETWKKESGKVPTRKRVKMIRISQKNISRRGYHRHKMKQQSGCST